MIALFVPFFPQAVEQHGIEMVISGLPHVGQLQIDTYSSYIQALRRQYPLIKNMDTTILATLALTLLEYFEYIQVLDAQRQETIESIKAYISM